MNTETSFLQVNSQASRLGKKRHSALLSTPNFISLDRNTVKNALCVDKSLGTKQRLK